MADELKKRTGAFAEGMVVMACPVLVAVALDKVELKVYGHHAFFAMLAMAGITLIIGICPFLVCWFSGTFVRPVPVTAILATISSCSLLILTCFMAQLVVPSKTLIIFGVVFGFLVLLRAVEYYLRGNFVLHSTGLAKILNESHEFLTGVTGVLFLWLEGLAWEGHDDPMFQKGGAVAVASFIVCAAGVCMMYLEMTPPRDFTEKEQIVGLTLTLDSFMAGGTFMLLMVVMLKLMGLYALFLLAPPFVVILELVYGMTVEDPPEVCALASLELTKVTITGFLAVSVTVIRSTSPSMLTCYFLLFVAVAIVFGLTWRLLSQAHIRSTFDGRVSPRLFDSSANLASLGIHVCIVIATVLLLAMAWTARGKPCQVVKPCS